MLLKKIMTTTMVVLALSVAIITGGSLAIGQTEGTGKPVDLPPIAAEKPVDLPPIAVAAKDAVVNTPTILGKLQGEWELQPKTEGEYKQRMIFTATSSGNWQRSKETLPVSITYYVEGRELLIQFYHEPNGAFNYRLKQLRFEYKLDKDILTLTAGDATQTWKRIPKANPKPEGVKMPPEKEAFTAWGKEVGGLQAGLGFKAGEKRVYTHGETVMLVVRVRNVGKEEVKFEYLRQFFIENPPAVTDGKGQRKQLGNIEPFGEHIPVKVNLPAGKEIELDELKFELGGSDNNNFGIGIHDKYSTIYGTGKFQVQYEKILGNSSSGTIKLDPALEKLATGKLGLEVEEPAKLNVGDTVSLEMTGELAAEYAKQTGSIKGDKVPDGLQISTSATIAQKLKDGQIRIEHTFHVTRDGKPDRLVTLTATVDSTKLTPQTTQKGTPVYTSPGDKKNGDVPKVTTKETKFTTVHLSELKGVKLYTWKLENKK